MSQTTLPADLTAQLAQNYQGTPPNLTMTGPTGGVSSLFGGSPFISSVSGPGGRLGQGFAGRIDDNGNLFQGTGGVGNPNGGLGDWTGLGGFGYTWNPNMGGTQDDYNVWRNWANSPSMDEKKSYGDWLKTARPNATPPSTGGVGNPNMPGYGGEIWSKDYAPGQNPFEGDSALNPNGAGLGGGTPGYNPYITIIDGQPVANPMGNFMPAFPGGGKSSGGPTQQPFTTPNTTPTTPIMGDLGGNQPSVTQPTQQPITGDFSGGTSGGNPMGLSHIKDYGPIVDQMQGYVKSMSDLINQINSKF